jgi:pantetheine-phosphate adenylyltransferase
MKPTHAVYPGSFDPPTLGHLDVIKRASDIFAYVTVAVVVNPQKSNPLFSLEEREAMLQSCVAPLGNVSVDNFSGLLANFVRSKQIDVIVKGLRVLSDFESEMATAHMNRSLSGVDTMFLMSDAGFSFVSSSLVKEVFRLGGDVSHFVPPVVLNHMNSTRQPSGGLNVDLSRHR